jgi:hypothetical protein
VHFEECHRDRKYQWAKTVGAMSLDFQTARVQTAVSFKVRPLMPLVRPAHWSALWDTNVEKRHARKFDFFGFFHWTDRCS